MRFRTPRLRINAEKTYDIGKGETLTLVLPFNFEASGPIGTMAIDTRVTLRCEWDGEILRLVAPGLQSGGQAR